MKVAIDSADTQKFTKLSNLTSSELACKSIINLIRNSRIDKNKVDGLIVTSCTNEPYLGNIISEMVGIKPKISTKIENLCNSGTSGIMLAYSLIYSGICNAVIVTGMEKQPSPGNKLIWDISRGQYDMPVHWAALYAENHFRKYGTSKEDLARVSLKNHRNANLNPNSLFYNKQFSYEDIMISESIVEPLRKLDCCFPCEGSSSILLVSENYSKISENPIWITGISQSNEGASFTNISDNLQSIYSTRIAAREAFKQSCLEPKDINIVEIHDAFSILEILAYEDIGFTKKGRGAKFIENQQVYTNTRGGLIGCGHPIGATGIAQTSEIVYQLQEKANHRQKKNCHIGLIHNMAAAGTSSTIIILEDKH